MSFKFFSFPIFMGRKKRVEVLNAMLTDIQKSDKKKRCDICKRLFKKEDSRWSMQDLTSSICILCHKKYWNQRLNFYSSNEIKELNKQRKEQKHGDDVKNG